MDDCDRKVSQESHLCGFHAGRLKHYWRWVRRNFPLKTAPNPDRDITVSVQSK